MSGTIHTFDRPRSSLRVGLTYRKPAPPLPPGSPLFRPTAAHLALWVERNAPKWAKGLRLPVAGADIDSIINKRAGIKYSNEVHNALYLALLVRQNCERGAYGRNDPQTLPDYLRAFPLNSSSHDRGRRAIFARWVRGLDRARARAARLTSTP